MAKGTNVKTQVGTLQYLFIDGEGRNQARKGEEPKFMYVASLVAPENGPVHKHAKAQVDAEWKAYKEERGLKGLPKSTGIKPQMQPDPSGAIDPETEEIKKIPTGNVIITFKTKTKWPDGNAQVVKVFDKKGADITAAVTAAPWSIGNGSTGVIHGKAMGNDVGGDNKVTLYLSAVQLSTLSKYEGSEIVTEEIDGDDIDLGEAVSALSDDETPEL